MKMTAAEKQMYAVMRAIYESGIPVSFKGAMVLKACLSESGYADETRHTMDIDANWNSTTSPSAEQLVGSLEKALAAAGIRLNITLYRMYGEGRSAGFELTDPDTDEVLFTMDIDVNRPAPQTRIYEIEGIRFRGASPVQMMEDKLSAISTDQVFRRIKDVVDLYYMSKVFDFSRSAVLLALQQSGRTPGSFEGFLHRQDELRHSYEKFRFAGSVSKPGFDDVYQSVKAFISPVLPEA